jgi:hypothetical protein
VGSASAVTDWDAFARRVARLQPPLAPHSADVAGMARMIAGADDHVLLLGMTTALFGLGRRQTAVDWNAAMIAALWPGDSPDRVALAADWREMAPPEVPVTAIVGDGSFNTLEWPADFARLAAHLATIAPGAVLAVRCFLTPSPGAAEALADLAAAPLGGFHAMKWRIAMALAAETGEPMVAVADIAAAFDRLFPDRAALAARSGWAAETIAEIDSYRGSPARYAFPTAAQALAAFGDPPGASFVPGSGYELAERCPLLVWRLPA